jgi:phosphoribosyl 1,2-cyclic phosphate phosphodiesterase
VRKRWRIDMYIGESASRVIRPRFDYCFEKPPGSEYPPMVTEHRLIPGRLVTIEGEGGPIAALPVLQHHGDIASLGFRFGGFGYSCDLSGMPAESEAVFAGLDVWVVDALRYTSHPSHFSLTDALAWIARITPQRAILTNLHADLDFETLRKQLPANVEPAYDGITVELPG